MNEVWKPVEFVTGKRCRYEASDQGMIRSVSKNKTALLARIKWYPVKGIIKRPKFYISLAGRRFLVARVIARVFIGGCPKGKEVNHKDGNQLNNRIENLEYVTHRENMLHARRTGLLVCREKLICKKGHPKTRRPCGILTCLPCNRVWGRRWRESWPRDEYLLYERNRKRRSAR